MSKETSKQTNYKLTTTKDELFGVLGLEFPWKFARQRSFTNEMDENKMMKYYVSVKCMNDKEKDFDNATLRMVSIQIEKSVIDEHNSKIVEIGTANVVTFVVYLDKNGNMEELIVYNSSTELGLDIPEIYNKKILNVIDCLFRNMKKHNVVPYYKVF